MHQSCGCVEMTLATQPYIQTRGKDGPAIRLQFFEKTIIIVQFAMELR
jgi:hypothetical protein